MKFNKKVTVIILINFILLLFGVYSLATSCRGTVSECLLNNEKYFSDFYLHFNAIKYISVYKSLPFEVAYYEDGGYDGAFLRATMIQFSRGPVYHILGALVYSASEMAKILPLLSLHIFSVIILLFTSIFSFLFIRKMSKLMKTDGKKFILYSLLLLLFLPTNLHVGLGVQDDILFYFLFVAFLYAYVRLLEKRTKKEAVILGLLLGLALLSRISGIVLTVSLVLTLVYLVTKKDYELAKLYAISFLISLIGTIIFIRNKLIFDNLLGSSFYTVWPQKDFGVFIRTYRAFWGGIEGGNSHVYPLLIFISLALTFLTIYGLFVYQKELNNKPALKFLTILFFVVILFAIDFNCKLSTFLVSFKCFGDAVQNRYIVILCPLIALFSSLALVNLEKKHRCLSKLIHIFIALMVVSFSVDFISALLKI